MFETICLGVGAGLGFSLGLIPLALLMRSADVSKNDKYAAKADYYHQETIELMMERNRLAERMANSLGELAVSAVNIQA